MTRPLTDRWSTKLGFHINPKLVSNLLYWRNMALHHDADCVLVVDGKEGTGKSVMGMQIAKFMDKDHTIDVGSQLHFSSEKVIEYAQKLPPGKVIIYDEAGEALDVGLASTKKQKLMKQMFKEVRQRNLIFILVLPSYYDLQRYFAVHRTRALIHVYWKVNISDVESEKYFKRGYYRYYNEYGKKILYVTDRIRKEYEYPTSWYGKDLSLFTGKFFKTYVIPEASYRKKKRDYSSSLTDGTEEPEKIDWRKKSIKVLAHLDGVRLLKVGWMGAATVPLGRSKRWMTSALQECSNVRSATSKEEAHSITTIKGETGEITDE